MNHLQLGACYHYSKTNIKFRVFHLGIQENEAVIARIDTTSTRLRHAGLDILNAGIAEQTIVPIPDPYVPPRPLEAQSPAAQKKFICIRPALLAIWSLGVHTLASTPLRPILRREALKVGVPPATLQRSFTEVIIAGGIIEAALPRWSECGQRKGTFRPAPAAAAKEYVLGPKDLRQFERSVRLFYRDGRTMTEVFDQFLAKYHTDGFETVGNIQVPKIKTPGLRPSWDQFRTHAFRSLSVSQRIQATLGTHALLTTHRGSPVGQSAPAIYPGFVSEVDWTFNDNVAVARKSRLSVGRLVVYVIADVFSGEIQAAYMTMDSGCVKEAGRALLMCLEDKVPLCARVGLTITADQWASRHLPVELRCDKGEIDSWKATGLGTRLGIRLEYCPARRPDLKGTIESFFRILRFFMRRLRGGTTGHYERLREHPNVTAVYDFDQLQRLLFALVVRVNARVRRRQALTPGMVADHVLPVPSHIAQWGRERGLMREFPIEKARLGCLPTHFASVTQHGIYIKGLTFLIPDLHPDSPGGISANDMLIRARKQRFKVEVGIDPSTVDYVWLRHRPKDGAPMEIQCPLSARHEAWRGLSWMEYGTNCEEYRQAIQTYSETTLRKVRLWMLGVVAGTTDEAVRMTEPKRRGLSNAAQIQGAADRRKGEKTPPPEFSDWLNNSEEFFPEAEWVEAHKTSLS